jgi:hypothetical protein
MKRCLVRFSLLHLACFFFFCGVFRLIFCFFWFNRTAIT